jgi:hypothetical protein
MPVFQLYAVDSHGHPRLVERVRCRHRAHAELRALERLKSFAAVEVWQADKCLLSALSPDFRGIISSSCAGRPGERAPWTLKRMRRVVLNIVDALFGY